MKHHLIYIITDWKEKLNNHWVSFLSMLYKMLKAYVFVSLFNDKLTHPKCCYLLVQNEDI